MEPIEKNPYMNLNSLLDMQESFVEIEEQLASISVEVEQMHKETGHG